MVKFLLYWTYWRGKNKSRIYLDFIRLSIDFVTLIYFYIPGIIIGGYFLYKYYYNSIPEKWANLYLAGTALTSWFYIGFSLLLAMYIRGIMGTLVFPLPNGDKLIIFSSPIPRRSLLTWLVIENHLISTALFLAVFILTYPIGEGLSISPWRWILLCSLAGLNIGAIRLWSTAKGLGRYWQLLRRFAPYVLTFFLVGSIRLVALKNANMNIGAFSFLALLFIVQLVISSNGLRVSWEGFFSAKPSKAISKLVDSAYDSTDNIQFRLKKLPHRILKLMEFILKKPLHPLDWIIIIRAIRRKSFVKNSIIFILAATISLFVVNVELIKLILVVLLGVLLNEWWKIAVVPLYLPIINEQTIVQTHVLHLRARRIKFFGLLIIILFWLIFSLF